MITYKLNKELNIFDSKRASVTLPLPPVIMTPT